MNTFMSIHQDALLGTLATFDRVIFKGYLTGLFPKGAFGRYLSKQGVLLKDFGQHVSQATQAIKVHMQELAKEAGRPLMYLASAPTRAKGDTKEDRVRAMAAEAGVTEGLVCIFSVLETCMSFVVRGNRETHKLEAVRQVRKCLHYYVYYLDPEFGLMHIRIQSWFPFNLQIYINGREWLARQLDQRGIAYQRSDNKLFQIADLDTAQALCDKFAHRRWPRVLDTFARRVNPHLPILRRLGFGGYYWVIDQAEYATDVLFRDPADLAALFPALVELAMTALSADDVMRFLGRKPHGNFQGQVTTDHKRRKEGRRVKHCLKSNSLKMYDVPGLLRVETTTINPREFRVLRVVDTPHGRQRRWCPMGKGVANFWRFAQVGRQSNLRYLNLLAHAQPKGKAIAELDRLCRPALVEGKRYARFYPVTAQDCHLFAAVLAGEHALTGFRNKNLQARLYSTPPASPAEQRQRSARVTRSIAKLHGHGLIAKVKDARLYRVTERGASLMAAAILCRNKEFPTQVLQPA